ncbi:MAG: lactate utilization protein [Minisyncoccota bacterium]
MSYTELANREVLQITVDALKKHNFETVVVNNKEEALAHIKTMIPVGASINNGSSTTLQQIGFIDYLKSNEHSWNNLHEAVLIEQDPEKQTMLRQQSVFADYALSSVHAVTETGDILIASASGSQLPAIAFTSPNIIFVVGTQKIVPTIQDALTRIREHVFPLENERMKNAGMGGSVLAKILLLEQEPAFMNRKVTVIFVHEVLGF